MADQAAPPQDTAFAQVVANAVSVRAPDHSPICEKPEMAGVAPRHAAPAQILVLSGGSLHGAFGAGFFLGLQDADALPPEADVVTGVSTGSLQATFLFLAREPVPADRTYKWADGLATHSLPGAGQGQPLRGGHSNVEDLALAYSIAKESDILNKAPFSFVGALAKGSLGTLTPLRTRLMSLITPGTIRAVAREACRGRKLFVGGTDVDDGKGYAFDLTALALKAYESSKPEPRMTQVRNLYVDALIASSSAPLAAPPVHLRVRETNPLPVSEESQIHLFVDGGARFGVFFDQIRTGKAIATSRNALAADTAVTLVVNTSLQVQPWVTPDDRKNPRRNPKKGWSLLSLGLRSVSILENQVYQTSVASVIGAAGQLKVATIDNEALFQSGQPAEYPDDHVYGGQTCAQWHKLEEAKLHPVQFYPSYMACILDYGRRRGALGEWNH